MWRRVRPLMNPPTTFSIQYSLWLCRSSHRTPPSSVRWKCLLNRVRFALPSIALLARLTRLRPELRVAGHMKYREHHNTIRLDAVEHRIRKSRHDSTSYLAVYACEHLRELLDGVKRSLNRAKELLPKASPLVFVPPDPASQVPSDPPTVDGWQRHQGRRASARISSRVATSSGLRSCSARRSSSTAR